MSYETHTQQEEGSSVNEPGETNDARRPGITQLPGYEALEERLRSSQSDQRPGKDTIFDVLRNRRRRYVLRYLGEHEGVVELGALAEALADWESEGDEYMTYKDRKRAYVSLYQTHLPKLDRAGIVEYNQPRGTVEIGPEYHHVKGLLQYSHDGTLLWHRLYLGSGVATVGVLGLAQLTVFPFVSVPDAAWFAMVLVVFGSVLFVHARTDHDVMGSEPPE